MLATIDQQTSTDSINFSVPSLGKFQNSGIRSLHQNSVLATMLLLSRKQIFSHSH
jgi:hypothetical protein